MLLNTFWSIILIVYTGSHTQTHTHTKEKAHGSHANHSCCCLVSQYWDCGIQSSTMTPAPLGELGICFSPGIYPLMLHLGGLIHQVPIYAAGYVLA